MFFSASCCTALQPCSFLQPSWPQSPLPWHYQRHGTTTDATAAANSHMHPNHHDTSTSRASKPHHGMSMPNFTEGSLWLRGPHRLPSNNVVRHSTNMMRTAQCSNLTLHVTIGPVQANVPQKDALPLHWPPPHQTHVVDAVWMQSDRSSLCACRASPPNTAAAARHTTTGLIIHRGVATHSTATVNTASQLLSRLALGTLSCRRHAMLTLQHDTRRCSLSYKFQHSTWLRLCWIHTCVQNKRFQQQA
jgi:hypothetical protein